ncbi:hypothetical protein H0H87_007330 [Tephrocybe sp. NHM501043]|nr:hypothetical protein H0H87_007330 [Tephrocybe sp. NHM501043]
MGSLTPGKGNRLVLANTEELHERIEVLATRNRELEAALRSLQHSASDPPHTRLQKDVPQPQPNAPHNSNPTPDPTPPTTNTSPSAAPTPPEQPPDQFNCQSTDADDENFVDAFGTLTLGPRGHSIFHGRTARSEFLALEHHQPRATPIPPRLSKHMIDVSCADSLMCNSELVREAFSMLPPLSEAAHLCEVYQEYGKFMYTPVPRAELFDEILTSIYRLDSFEGFSNPDSVALLFSVFAIGALFDPDRQPYSVESQEFYHLARAIVRCDSRPSRTLIQAISTILAALLPGYMGRKPALQIYE